MTWTKLDDGFHSHPKVLAAGLEAVGLHTLALSYSSQYLTDGHVGRAFVERHAGRRADRLAQQLVDAGLWEPNGGDEWVIHDYLEFNPSREQITARRRADSNRKRSGR